MKKLFGYVLIIAVLAACSGDNSSNGTTRENEVKIHYLNSEKTAYTRCVKSDTLVLDGRTFIKVYGVTDCKYGCPVLIEVK